MTSKKPVVNYDGFHREIEDTDTLTVDITAGLVTLADMADLAQDKIIGRATASTGAPEVIDCTTAGRALLDDANAAAQRSTLGLGTMAVETAADYVTKAAHYFLNVKECGDADYTILDADGFDTFIFRAITADRVLNLPTLADNLNRKIRVILVSDDGSGHKVTVTHEGTDKMNGYAADIDITEWGGWWELVGTATEWRAITDGNSTIARFTSSADVAGSGAVLSTWYNPTNHSLAVPTYGKWEVYYSVGVYGYLTTAYPFIIKSTLAKSTGNEDDIDLTTQSSVYYVHATSTGVIIENTFTKKKIVNISAATTFYLNIRYEISGGGTASSLITRGSKGSTIIELRRIA